VESAVGCNGFISSIIKTWYFALETHIYLNSCLSSAEWRAALSLLSYVCLNNITIIYSEASASPAAARIDANSSPAASKPQNKVRVGAPSGTSTPSPKKVEYFNVALLYNILIVFIIVI